MNQVEYDGAVAAFQQAFGPNHALPAGLSDLDAFLALCDQSGSTEEAIRVLVGQARSGAPELPGGLPTGEAPALPLTVTYNPFTDGLAPVEQYLVMTNDEKVCAAKVYSGTLSFDDACLAQAEWAAAVAAGNEHRRQVAEQERLDNDPEHNLVFAAGAWLTGAGNIDSIDLVNGLANYGLLSIDGNDPQQWAFTSRGSELVSDSIKGRVQGFIDYHGPEDRVGYGFLVGSDGKPGSGVRVNAKKNLPR